MEKKINARIQKKIDNIIQLKSELRNWEKLNEDDVLKSLKGFEKTPRDEVSTFYVEHLNDSNFAEILLDIAHKYETNTKINVLVVSALGNILERYKMPESKRIYDFFVANSQKKGVSIYVALFLTRLKEFNAYANNWEYIMSIKDMKPSKMADSTFEMVLKNKKTEIPTEYRDIVINHFLKKAEKANSESGQAYFLSIVDELK